MNELQPAGNAVKAEVFGTSQPQGIVARATEIANNLVPLVNKANLYNIIQGKKFIRAEGWTTMAAMLGVFPETEYCRKLDREDEITYEARIVLTHISGMRVGAGEAICSNKELSKQGFNEYAIASMAQTRAVGKACRLSFSWIMALAGYEATPAEEMDNSYQNGSQMHRKADFSPDYGQSGSKPRPPVSDADKAEAKALVEEAMQWAIAMELGDTKKAEDYIIGLTAFPEKDKEGKPTGKTIYGTLDQLSTKIKWARRVNHLVKTDYQAWMKNEPKPDV